MAGKPSLSEDLFPSLEGIDRLMLIGPTDVGKSTFITRYLKHLRSKGVVPWVVDLDVGQSDVGPVGTLAAARADRDFSLLEELEPSFVEFFGYLAPSFDLITYMWCLRRLALHLREASPLVIDTTGWVSGYEAFSLKLVKSLLFRVDAVVLVGESLCRWSKAFEAVGVKTFCVDPSPHAIRKDKKRRRINRYAATEAFFRDKPAVRIRLGEYALWTRSFKDLKFSLIGGLDDRLATVYVGWIVEHEGDTVVAKLYVIRKMRPSIIRIGQKVTL